MREHWERSTVTGTGTEDGRVFSEEILHRRGEDPMVLAFRRNLRLAGCNSVRQETEEAFLQIRELPPARRNRKEIPKETGARYEEWDW